MGRQRADERWSEGCPVRGGNLDIAHDFPANAEPGEAMKFVLASWGSRGDVEPNLAVGRELVRRGHDVCMAVPPDLVGFTEAAGVSGGRLRTGSAVHPGLAPRILDVLLQPPLEDPDSNQVADSTLRGPCCGVGRR